MHDRLQRWREYLQRLEGAGAGPKVAIEHGFYVDRPHGSLAREIAGRLELRPATAHLLLGAIGSGKSTELRVAEQRLAEVHDAWPLYVDISRSQDIAKLKPGLLTGLLALEMSRALSASVPAAREHLEESMEWAQGREVSTQINPFADVIAEITSQYTSRTVPGHITPPQTSTRAAAEGLARLRKLRDLSPKPHVVFLVDGLDRLQDLDVFRTMVDTDVRALKDAGYGIVIVGPIGFGLAPNPLTMDAFDHDYHQPAIDVANDPVGFAFLREVLRKRVPDEVIGTTALDRMIGLSGGIVRELLLLAQSACEEAYIRGLDAVNGDAIDTAAHRLGRRKLVGADEKDLHALERIAHEQTSTAATVDHLTSLVVRGLVLQYRGEPGTTYAVHPTIRSLLPRAAA